jgi:hypothetical protein
MTTRRRRSRWNDPKVWVPVLTTVIASVVGPILVIYYQNLFPSLGTGGGGEVTGGGGEGGLGIDVDKPSYVVYETAVFSGSIGKAEEGKTVRIDVYDPRGRVFQDNLSTKTDIDGAYSYPVTLQNYGDTTMTGQYTAIVTYSKQSAATKFNSSQAAS